MDTVEQSTLEVLLRAGCKPITAEAISTVMLWQASILGKVRHRLLWELTAGENETFQHTTDKRQVPASIPQKDEVLGLLLGSGTHPLIAAQIASDYAHQLELLNIARKYAMDVWGEADCIATLG